MLEKSGVRLRLPASYPTLSAPPEGGSVLSLMHGASPEDQDLLPPSAGRPCQQRPHLVRQRNLFVPPRPIVCLCVQHCCRRSPRFSLSRTNRPVRPPPLETRGSILVLHQATLSPSHGVSNVSVSLRRVPHDHLDSRLRSTSNSIILGYVASPVVPLEFS